MPVPSPRALLLTLAFAALPALGLPGVAGAQRIEAPLDVRVALDVRLDPEGHVQELEVVSPSPSVLTDRVERAVRSWEFDAGHVEGVPAETFTRLVVTLRLESVNANALAMRVLHVETGAAAEQLQPPRYPEGAIRNGEEGLVVLRVRYDADGRVIGAEAHGDAPRPPPRLLRASLDAAAGWQLRPERVGGIGVPGEIAVPLCYRLDWPARPCDWTPAGTGRPQPSGEILALASMVSLRTEAEGRLL